MAEKDLQAIARQVEQILDELVRDATAAAGGGAIDADVAKFWQVQYRAKFFYAILMRDKNYDDDRDNLKPRFAQLGEVARTLAGNDRAITTMHAAMASYAVDCRPVRDDVPQINWEWCN